MPEYFEILESCVFEADALHLPLASEFGRPRTLLILVLVVHDTTVDLLLVKKPAWVGTAARTIVKGDH